MRMITGFRPIDGNFEIPAMISVKILWQPQCIGYLPENAPVANMTVSKFLDFVARIRGYRGSECFTRSSKVIE